jgi:hypothetical protein
MFFIKIVELLICYFVAGGMSSDVIIGQGLCLNMFLLQNLFRLSLSWSSSLYSTSRILLLCPFLLLVLLRFID